MPVVVKKRKTEPGLRAKLIFCNDQFEKKAVRTQNNLMRPNQISFYRAISRIFWRSQIT
jgi:hypothetical protein